MYNRILSLLDDLYLVEDSYFIVDCSGIEVSMFELLYIGDLGRDVDILSGLMLMLYDGLYDYLFCSGRSFVFGGLFFRGNLLYLGDGGYVYRDYDIYLRLRVLGIAVGSYYGIRLRILLDYHIGLNRVSSWNIFYYLGIVSGDFVLFMSRVRDIDSFKLFVVNLGISRGVGRRLVGIEGGGLFLRYSSGLYLFRYKGVEVIKK